MTIEYLSLESVQHRYFLFIIKSSSIRGDLSRAHFRVKDHRGAEYRRVQEALTPPLSPVRSFPLPCINTERMKVLSEGVSCSFCLSGCYRRDLTFLIYIYIFYFPWGGTGDVELLIKGIERHFVERLHALSRRDINPRVNRLLLAVDILPSRIRRYCLPGGVFHRIVSIYFIAVEMERRSFVSSFNLDSTELFYSLFFICSIFFDEQ